MRTTRYDARVAGIAKGLIDSLRQARRGCTVRESDRPNGQFASHVFKAISRYDARQFACHQLALVLVDAFDGGAPEEDVQAFARELQAEVHYLYMKRDGVAPEAVPSVHQAEEHAEGIAEEAELAFVYDPCPSTFLRLETAKARHIAESQRLLESARIQALRGVVV